MNFASNSNAYNFSLWQSGFLVGSQGSHFQEATRARSRQRKPSLRREFSDAAGSHPAVFPVALVEASLTAFSGPGDLIYEPFCGSGTQLVAAERAGRRCYAMELDPVYCDVAVRRWEMAAEGRQLELWRSKSKSRKIPSPEPRGAHEPVAPHVAGRSRHQCRGGLCAGRRNADRGVLMVWPAHEPWPKPDDQHAVHRDLARPQLHLAQGVQAMGVKLRRSGAIQTMYRAAPIDLLRSDRQAQLLLQRPRNHATYRMRHPAGLGDDLGNRRMVAAAK